MTFQFTIEYIDNNEILLPLDYEYSNEFYAYLFMNDLVHTKRIRAHSQERAIQKFTQMYPDYVIISMR